MSIVHTTEQEVKLAAITPAEAEAEIVKAEERLDVLWRLMKMRVRATAVNDVRIGTKHDAGNLFAACGSTDLMFALERLYKLEKIQQQNEAIAIEECREVIS